MKKSIRQQLLLWLLVPLMTLAVLSTFAAHSIGLSLAREIYDKQLLNSADSVVARIKRRNEKITVDLPPAAQSILRHNYRDQFYYQVLSSRGKIIFGDKDLPSPPEEFTGDPYFRTMTIGNNELRIVTMAVPSPEAHTTDVPENMANSAEQAATLLTFPPALVVLRGDSGTIFSPKLSLVPGSLRAPEKAAQETTRSVPDRIIVQAAETRNTRAQLASDIAMSFLLAQMLLIFSGAAAIWIGIGRGLLPLTKVAVAVEKRSPGDLSPLQVEEPVEVAPLIRALNGMIGQVEADVELQKRFVANAAHQLRTPLAVLGTYCDLACKLVKEGEAREVLAELEAGIKRMSRMVSRLLSLARSEPSVALKRANEKVDISTLASAITAANVPESIKKKLELEFRSPSTPAVVYGDQHGLEEMISNLVENAVAYTPAGGHIVVSVLVDDAAAVFEVEDSGPGIPVEERSRIFERFYRLSGTEEPGTGLGLAIVKEVAVAHGATVEVTEGAANKGARFRVRFPASAARKETL